MPIPIRSRSSNFLRGEPLGGAYFGGDVMHVVASSGGEDPALPIRCILIVDFGGMSVVVVPVDITHSETDAIDGIRIGVCRFETPAAVVVAMPWNAGDIK